MNELPMSELVRAILILIAAIGIILLIAHGIMRKAEKDEPVVRVWKPGKEEPGKHFRGNE